MSVLSYLDNLASTAILDDDEKSSIETSISTLQTRLNNYFLDELKEHFEFGSSTRGTILPRNMDSESDIDYMIVFDDDTYKPQTYLDKLKRFAEAKYSTSEIYQSSPTVVLNLNHIKFELVPAIDKGFYGYHSYYIPAKASDINDWIPTDPNGFNETLTQKNQYNNCKIKPMIRLVKYWNANRGHLFYSFLKEKDIVDKYYYNCSNVKDYFFDYMLSMPDSGYQYQKTTDEVKRAKKIINQVKEYENSGYPVTAENEIKKLLPEV